MAFHFISLPRVYGNWMKNVEKSMGICGGEYSENIYQMVLWYGTELHEKFVSPVMYGTFIYFIVSESLSYQGWHSQFILWPSERKTKNVAGILYAPFGDPGATNLLLSSVFSGNLPPFILPWVHLNCVKCIVSGTCNMCS